MQRTQLVVRFALELVALAAFGLAGWNLSGNQVMSVALAVLMPICAGLTWGIFRTPGDPSAGKSCKVAVPGWMRLTLEIGFFVLAAWSFWVYASRAIAETFLTLVGLHYLLTWERVRWLLTGR